MLDDAHELHDGARAIDGLCGAVEARRVDAVRPADELVERGVLHAEALASDPRDQGGAGGRLGVVEEPPVFAARFEMRAILGRGEGRSVMIEVPAEPVARAVAVVEDGVLVARQHRVIGARLPRPVPARAVRKFRTISNP
jgi:hypothetical protein